MRYSNYAKALLTICVAAPTFAAQYSSTPDITTLATEADLVFQGKATNVDYKLAETNKDSISIPYTLVTYDVSEVLHGNYSNKQITLRFLGGPTADGSMMLSSNAPLIDLNDEDILFVKDNGSADCPLVECSSGRLRVVDGALYSENGQPILEDAEGSLHFGKTVDREEFQKFSIGKQTFQKKHSKNTQTTEGIAEASSDADSGYALTVSRMKTRVQEKLNTTSDPYGKSKSVHTVDKNAEIAPKASTPVTMPASKSTATKNSRLSDEEKALRNNNGNPVINSQ